MKIIIAFIAGLSISIGGFFVLQPNETTDNALGAFSDPFLSIQLSTTTATSGYVLSTDGINNLWIANTGGGGGGGGFPTYFQNGGATLNVATTTVNFTPNSFVVVEDPADTLTIRVATTTFGLLTTNVAEGSNLYFTDPRVSSYLYGSTTRTGLYTAGTGVDWTGTTLNTVLTAGDGLTLTGEDFDCDTASGSTFGCLSSSDWTTFNNKGAGTVTSVDFSVPTGLSIANNPITTSGTLALTYTSGYTGVLTASTTNWNGFYDVPSTRITAGTGIDWSSNTLNGVYTAGDGITLNTEDFDCDIASGSIFGCLSSTDWNIFNNKLASTSIDTSAELDTIVTDDTGSGALVFANTPTLAGLVTLDYASTTGISGTNLNFTNATSSTSFFSGLGTFTNLIVNTLATFFNVVVTGLLDVGAGVLEIPNGTDPTVDSVGETAVNTATSSIRFHDGTAERQLKSEWAWGSTLASSSLSADGAFGTGGTTTVKRAGFMYGVTHTEYYCRTNVGNVTIVVGDGTASSSPVRCTETGATTTASNGAFNAREMINLAVGSADGNTLTSDIYFDATARWTTD